MEPVSFYLLNCWYLHTGLIYLEIQKTHTENNNTKAHIHAPHSYNKECVDREVNFMLDLDEVFL